MQPALISVGVEIMMLSNIGFDGFLLKSSSCKINRVSDSGTFNVYFSDPDINLIKNEDSNNQKILISYQVEMLGYSEGSDPSDDEAEPAFEAQFALETAFLDTNEKFMDEKDIEENMWFFENFNQISFKIAAENTFKNSNISDIPIPWTAKVAVLGE